VLSERFIILAVGVVGRPGHVVVCWLAVGAGRWAVAVTVAMAMRYIQRLIHTECTARDWGQSAVQ
jgi:hypothetical protein